MKPLHWVAVLFWVVVIGMILKQCHDSNVQSEINDEHTQKHFFFVPQPTQKQIFLPSVKADADVQQIAFTTRDDTPSAGSFSCDVTLKNLGAKTATGIQVAVRPFRGGRRGNDNIGRTGDGFINDNDPLAQQIDWLAFPDLAPGAQSTQSAVFLSVPNISAGTNANPEIDFKSVDNSTNQP